MFIIFAGLPGAGKSAVAHVLAERLNCVYLRIDTIEQAIRSSGILPAGMDIGGSGYVVACRVAADNLRSGRTVIADSVNPLKITRDAYKVVADQAGVASLEIEIVCSDRAEHRRRVETRSAAVDGLRLPTWSDVEKRDYETWDHAHLQIDTAMLSIAESVHVIITEVDRVVGESRAASLAHKP